MIKYVFTVIVIVAAINRESFRHFFGSKFTTAVLLEYVSSEWMAVFRVNVDKFAAVTYPYSQCIFLVRTHSRLSYQVPFLRRLVKCRDRRASAAPAGRA